MRRSGILWLFLSLLLLSGCEQKQEAAATGVASEAASVVESPIDEVRYIRASDLLERIERDSKHFVFDVRSITSFADAHIAGAISMPYGKVEKSDLAAINGLEIDTPIVTYCGCPHHLAGLAADQLIAWGYRNVRVLHEGFWYWHEQRYPLATARIRHTAT